MMSITGKKMALHSKNRPIGNSNQQQQQQQHQQTQQTQRELLQIQLNQQHQQAQKKQPVKQRGFNMNGVFMNKGSRSG